MAKSWWLAPAVALSFVVALGSCDTPDRRDEQETVTTKQSALTTSLFQSPVSYPTGSAAEALAIGDLDGDGRNDIALLTSWSNDPANDFMVHVFLQDTDGTLKPRVRYPVPATGSSIDVGDLNGDGRADVVVGIADSQRGLYQIGVLLQNAAGTLDALVSYPTAHSAQVKVGDFNGDGRMDVAGLRSGLDVFLQTETGGLAAPITYVVSSGRELDAGDVDGDGKTDVVVMHGGPYGVPNISVLLQTSDGALGAPASYSLGDNIITRGVAVGDTNGDGRNDIVVSYGGTPPSSIVARLLQNAGGALDAPVSYPSADNPSAMVLADVDGDGRKDGLVTHDGTGWLGVYRQYPSGNFVQEEKYTKTGGGAFEPQGLAVGDINGDGRPDAVMADQNAGLVVLRHVADTSLALAVTSPAGGPYYTNIPLTVRWTAGDIVAIAGFDVSMSFNNGTTYTPIAGCTGLPATATECAWTPTAAGFGIRVRVTARDSAGQTAFAENTFKVETPQISLMGVSSQYIGVATSFVWFHNLPPTDTVRVELSRDGGASYETLASATPISSSFPTTNGSFAWTVTGPATSTARLRVTANGSVPASATSNNFTIATVPALTVTVRTTGGVAYTTGLFVSWLPRIIPEVSTFRLELSRDGGATFQTIAASLSTVEGVFSGPVPGPAAADCRVRITANGTVPATGTSDSFTLVQTTHAITGPAAGSVLYVGEALAITWSTNLPATSSAWVQLSRNGGSTYETLVFNAPNTGRFVATVAGPATSAAIVRVSLSGSDGSVAATSGTFSIAVPSVTVTGPAPGASFFTGTPVAITWATNLPATSPVRVELSRNGGSTYENLALGAPNTGSFTWPATGPGTSAAIARVTASGPAGSVAATSGTFSIAVPSVTVTGPAASASFFAGTPGAITWSTNLPASSPVTVELSRDGGTTYEVLAAGAPNTGSFGWIATGPGTGAALARVTISGPATASGTSGLFGIVEPSLLLTGPAAGAAAYAGTPLAITWSTNLPAGSPVLVELSRDGGLTFETLAAAAPNTGRFDWIVAGPDSSDVRARVTVADPITLTSTSGAFAIATPSLAVTSPSAGALAWAGTPVTITWTHNLSDVDPVSIELSRDGGATFEVLAAAAANTGSFVWTAGGPDAAEARVRVTSLGAVPASGVGPAFRIVSPTLAVTSPAAGESWAIGTARTISWSSNLPAETTVTVALSRDGGATWTSLATAAPASGSLAWTATAPATSAAIVRVSANGGVPAVATSGTFAIGNPAVAVTSPAAGASWTIGTPQTITWTSNLLASATVKIQLSRNGGSTYTSLTASAPNTGSFAWTPTGSATTTAIVKVSANGFTASAVSGTFTLAAASVVVTAPNTAVTWTVGTVHAITWNHNVGAGAQFKIEVSRSGVWSVIDAAVTAGGATSGSYDWTVTGPKTTNAKIRVTWNGGTAKDTSDVAFKIN